MLSNFHKRLPTSHDHMWLDTSSWGRGALLIIELRYSKVTLFLRSRFDDIFDNRCKKMIDRSQTRADEIKSSITKMASRLIKLASDINRRSDRIMRDEIDTHVHNFPVMYRYKRFQPVSNGPVTGSSYSRKFWRSVILTLVFKAFVPVDRRGRRVERKSRKSPTGAKRLEIAWNCTVRGRWITVESWVAGSKNEGDRSLRRRSRNLERWQRRRRGVGSRHPKKSIMSLLCTARSDKSNEKYLHACSASLACACHDGLHVNSTFSFCLHIVIRICSSTPAGYW